MAQFNRVSVVVPRGPSGVGLAVVVTPVPVVGQSCGPRAKTWSSYCLTYMADGRCCRQRRYR
eukprot:1480241-Prymnesium_polylepis.1